jgi:Uma2 family endonuclease
MEPDERGMKGPPDLIIGITSPGTSHLYLKEKFDLYEIKFLT